MNSTPTAPTGMAAIATPLGSSGHARTSAMMPRIIPTSGASGTTIRHASTSAKIASPDVRRAGTLMGAMLCVQRRAVEDALDERGVIHAAMRGDLGQERMVGHAGQRVDLQAHRASALGEDEDNGMHARAAERLVGAHRKRSQRTPLVIAQVPPHA